MSNFSENIYKFNKEFITAESWKSKPRIDILWYHEDPCTFYIIEVKWNKNPERETITELLQYANWLQINDFPWLPNDNIVFVVVAKEWSNILIQSVINWIVFKNLNILPIKVSISKKNKKYEFSFFDIWNFDTKKNWILENLNKQIYNEKNYLNQTIAFDELKPWTQIWILKVEYEDMKKMTMMTALELAKNWYIWYVLWMEYNGNLTYKNTITILYFNCFYIQKTNKIIQKTKRKKSKILIMKMNIFLIQLY